MSRASDRRRHAEGKRGAANCGGASYAPIKRRLRADYAPINTSKRIKKWGFPLKAGEYTYHLSLITYHPYTYHKLHDLSDTIQSPVPNPVSCLLIREKRLNNFGELRYCGVRDHFKYLSFLAAGRISPVAPPIGLVVAIGLHLNHHFFVSWEDAPLLGFVSLVTDGDPDG